MAKRDKLWQNKGNILQLRKQYMLSESWYKVVFLPLEDQRNCP